MLRSVVDRWPLRGGLRVRLAPVLLATLVLLPVLVIVGAPKSEVGAVEPIGSPNLII